MYANSKLGISLVLLSAGYFLHDLIIVSINFSEAGFGFILHGFFCCSLYCYGVFSLQLQYFGEKKIPAKAKHACHAKYRSHALSDATFWLGCHSCMPFCKGACLPSADKSKLRWQRRPSSSGN